MMTNKQTVADSADSKLEPTVAEVIGLGDMIIPPVGGKMLREWIGLPDGSWLRVKISRRKSAPPL